jgi:hypothetical protein
MGTDQQTMDKPCPHGSTAPHWDNAQDFGKHDLISYYICEACGAHLSPEERERATAVAAEGVRIDDSLRKTTEEMLEGEKRGDV